ncbi:MAG: hypothetical protein KDB27_12400 [Planctomycetales bacterium]|nr:hypothetical protein [Planctomycetales bacterium]
MIAIQGWDLFVTGQLTDIAQTDHTVYPCRSKAMFGPAGKREFRKG